jgi:hypothetical protein
MMFITIAISGADNVLTALEQRDHDRPRGLKGGVVSDG